MRNSAAFANQKYWLLSSQTLKDDLFQLEPIRFFALSSESELFLSETSTMSACGDLAFCWRL